MLRAWPRVVWPRARGGVGPDISRGRWGSRQLGGFSVVIVIVALFVPNVCPVGGGMWGIFVKPLKRAIWVCMLY